jgi:hypothetical protein
MTEPFELWCEGLPHVADRKLEESELEELRARVDAEHRSRRRQRVALRIVGIAVAVVTVGFVAWNPGDEPTGVTLGAAMGVMVLSAGFFGAVFSAIMGATAFGRWLFRFALTCLLVVTLAADHLPEGVGIALGLPAILGVLGGTISLWLHWRRWRRLRSCFAVIDGDLAEGTVLRFSGEESRFDPEDEEEDDEWEHPEIINIEVLPRSRLLHSVRGEPAPGWQTVELQRVAPTPATTSDQWPSGSRAEYQQADASHTYRDRALTEKELEELRRARKKLPRRMIIEALILTWGVALAARFIEWLLRWEIRPELSLAGWVAVGLIVLWRTVKHVRDWRSLGVDIPRGIVVRAWDRTGPGMAEEPDAEILPASGITWTHHGKPAPWRTVG